MFMLLYGTAGSIWPFDWLFVVQSWGLFVWPGLAGIGFAICYRTRRATVLLALFTVSLLVLSWDLAVLGALGIAMGARCDNSTVKVLLYGVVASHALIIVLSEVTLSKRVWRIACASRRVDLKKGFLDERIRPQLVEGGKRSWVFPVAIGPLLGVCVGKVLILVVRGGDARLLIGGAITLLSSAFISYFAWAWTWSFLFRTLIWETRSRRVLTVRKPGA
jgi:hypothetical protein